MYDLIGLEAGQAAGAVILLFLLLIAGGLKLYIWKYNLTVVMWRLHRRLDLELPSWRSAAGEPEPGTDLHRWEQQVTGEDGVTGETLARALSEFCCGLRVSDIWELSTMPQPELKSNEDKIWASANKNTTWCAILNNRYNQITPETLSAPSLERQLSKLCFF